MGCVRCLRGWEAPLRSRLVCYGQKKVVAYSISNRSVDCGWGFMFWWGWNMLCFEQFCYTCILCSVNNNVAKWQDVKISRFMLWFFKILIKWKNEVRDIPNWLTLTVLQVFPDQIEEKWFKCPALGLYLNVLQSQF